MSLCCQVRPPNARDGVVVLSSSLRARSKRMLRRVLLHSLAILPPADLATRWSAVRASYDREHAAKTVPHITLKQPFTLTGELPARESAMVERLRETCALHGHFSLDLQDVAVFVSRVHGHVVHVKVALSAPLRALQHAIVRLLAREHYTAETDDPAQEERLFYPHLTLAQGLTDEQARRMLQELAATWASSFDAVAVVVGRRGANGVWQRPYVLPLASC
jgi:2'-5' RNA ligase